MNLLHRYFLQLSFKGTHYHGWQIQKNAHSVQAELDNALSTVLTEKISTTGCGRTDTGVHAKEFYAHFNISAESLEKTGFDKENPDAKGLLHAPTLSPLFIFKLNSCLPHDIAVQQITKVNSNTHARFDAVSRTYQYFISRKKDPFNMDGAYYLYGNLDLGLMNRAAKILYDYTDFTCFSKSRTQVKTNDCKIIRAKWISNGSLLIFTITANRFLRGMVRAIVGTVIEVEKKKITLDEFREIIERKKRSGAGYAVPAHGLYLTEVSYPKTVFNKQ
ncbi:tRNA pseudouridine(38-40) synthase TruA [bacterium AH-315-M05]|nr:tRNA pseudouridine(38-40) synthase TruA [bacterium AH-315-M05]